MNQFWKEQEKDKEKCIYCRQYMYPKTVIYDNTKRKVCTRCGATLEISMKKKKLKQRDW